MALPKSASASTSAPALTSAQTTAPATATATAAVTAAAASKPKWTNGNILSSLMKLMSLERVDDVKFRSEHPSFSPGGPEEVRSYGGHFYAQAVFAASKTVRKGFMVHNVTGHFLLVSRTDMPFIYHVSVIRDGSGYVQRRVDATQDPAKGPCFTCVCSFKSREPNYNERGHKAHLTERYDAVLRGRTPDSWPAAPGFDSPIGWKMEEKEGPFTFPGLDMRKVDMTAYNEPRATVDRRQLQYYRVLGDMPSIEEDPNIHAVAHLYASDRNGLFPIPSFLGLGDNYSAIASLSHTVIFHVEADKLDMLDANRKPRWFCIDESIDKIGYGRGLMMVRIWDVATGEHIASAMQDGLLKMHPGERQNILTFSSFGGSKGKL